MSAQSVGVKGRLPTVNKHIIYRVATCGLNAVQVHYITVYDATVSVLAAVQVRYSVKVASARSMNDARTGYSHST